MNLKEKQYHMYQAALAFSKGVPIVDVMEKYNVCYASVYNALKRYNIPYEYTNGRSIFFDEDYFHIIDSEHKAYWLGFIFADGSVIRSDKKVSNYNRLSISLSGHDKMHLEKILTDLKYPTDKISLTNTTTSFGTHLVCSVKINSLKLVKDLILHNCHPRKTYVPSFPDDIPDSLINHFIRGYFDGDGCISGSKIPNFEITSEKYAISRIQNILMKFCHFRKTKLRYCRHSYTVRYGGINQIRTIYEWLYKNATVYLERKYNKF